MAPLATRVRCAIWCYRRTPCITGSPICSNSVRISPNFDWPTSLLTPLITEFSNEICGTSCGGRRKTCFKQKDVALWCCWKYYLNEDGCDHVQFYPLVGSTKCVDISGQRQITSYSPPLILAMSRSHIGKSNESRLQRCGLFLCWSRDGYIFHSRIIASRKCAVWVSEANPTIEAKKASKVYQENIKRSWLSDALKNYNHSSMATKLLLLER